MNYSAAPLIAPRSARIVGIHRVPAGATWRVLVTGTRCATVHTHWHDGRTVPCARPDAACPPCAAGLAKRMEAYVSVWNLSRRCAMVLALPEGAYLAMDRLAGPAMAGALRGRLFEFRRRTDSRRSPLEVSDLGAEPDPAQIPEALHVPRILSRAWGRPERPIAQAGAALRPAGFTEF